MDSLEPIWFDKLKQFRGMSISSAVLPQERLVSTASETGACAAEIRVRKCLNQFSTNESRIDCGRYTPKPAARR
jgi:hypothetical protein